MSANMQIYKDSQPFLSPPKVSRLSPNLGTLQKRIFETCKRSNWIKSPPKHIFALVSSTLKYKAYIEYIIKKIHILEHESVKLGKLHEHMIMLLLHDLVFSRAKRIQSHKHPWKDIVMSYQPKIKAAVKRLLVKHGAKSVDELKELVEDDDTPIRWFRVNLLRTNKKDLLSQQEFKRLERVYTLSDVKTKGPGVIYYDEYVTNLFGVHPREKLTSTKSYKEGKIIIQDRASCFPAEILNPTGSDVIIDACAAPGNKTTHLASKLKGKSKSVIAFEKDNTRINTIKMMVAKAGGLGVEYNEENFKDYKPSQNDNACITIHHGDFTESDPNSEEFKKVTGILLDPSCSGSGIFGRSFDEQSQDFMAEKKNEERLRKLSAFQYRIVKHAMCFPKSKKIIYSTCSINNEENEIVVRKLLEDPVVKKQGWKLMERLDVLENWPRRGRPEVFIGMNYYGKDIDENLAENLAGGCVRALPRTDGGIGFFAAAFYRE
ncbi:rRNA (cytosine-C5-)-methyltransferase [Martiniozyma asiatica (nom. inval.)]|nr:rRNA (cytosine-C5-)-methyltransferase [Martiniozyma asiatica]